MQWYNISLEMNLRPYTLVIVALDNVQACPIRQLHFTPKKKKGPKFCDSPGIKHFLKRVPCMWILFTPCPNTMHMLIHFTTNVKRCFVNEHNFIKDIIINQF